MGAIVFAALAGMMAVVQSGMNRIIAQSWGFSASLLLNGFVFLIFNAILFGVVIWKPQLFPVDYQAQGQLSQFRAFWIFPGICGFILVLGLATSIAQMGALQTFVICMASQVVCGLLWDLMIEQQPIKWVRLGGAGLALIGALIATK